MNDIIILDLLRSKAPKHGYRLKQESSAMFSSDQQLHNNTIYHSPQALHEKRLDHPEASRRRPAARPRLLYALTPSGKQTLTDKLRDFSESDIANPAYAFLLRVAASSASSTRQPASASSNSETAISPPVSAVFARSPKPTSSKAGPPAPWPTSPKRFSSNANGSPSS